MRKITFERAVLAVFILIILISTSDTTLKYLDRGMNRLSQAFKAPAVSTNTNRSLGFPTMLMMADNLYKAGDFEKAADEYYKMTLNNTLILEQKVHAYFRLGICQYNLKKYEQAVDSFSRVASFNTSDSLAYNNAAVSAFRAKDIHKAIELQKKALDILPVVEYYYNLGRMYEDNEEYELAADNYSFVATGEKNLTKADRIDPVRVKEKVARLTPKNSASTGETENRIFRVYKLDDNRDILTVNENEMKLKEGDFVVKVVNEKTSKNILAEYDRVKYDPYNLISELLWTIYKDGKTIYQKVSDKISFNTTDGGNYEVKLIIKYNGSNEKVAAKTVKITETQSTVNPLTIAEVVVAAPPVIKYEKYYPDVIYEQLFESDFKISSQGYTDKYNVVWGTDNETQTMLYDRFYVEKSTSISIENQSSIDKGLWVNLDSLLKSNNLGGKTIKLSFYARRMTKNAKINLITRVKSEGRIIVAQDIRSIDDSWQQINSIVFIPENATGFTISINTAPNEQINIDGFTVTD